VQGVGGLEIPPVNQHFLHQRNLDVELIGRCFAWLDTGTPESLLEASNFIHTIEKRQGLKIAFDKKYISRERLGDLAILLYKNKYGEYLMKIVDKNKQ